MEDEEVVLPNFPPAPGYNEVLRPLGMHHCMITTFVDDGALIGRWPLWRSQGMPDWSREDATFMQAVVPYIAHGLRIGQMMARDGVASDGFLPLQNPAHGAVLLDHQYRVLSMDRNAQAVFAELASLDREDASDLTNGMRLALTYVGASIAQIFNAKAENSDACTIPRAPRLDTSERDHAAAARICPR